MAVPPPPNSRDLLPPLLACLPTSFVAPKPPPALLPLLSPLLQQRVNYLAGTTGSEGWLTLLSWDVERASKLPDVVERMDLEPHPVSGELELEEVRPAKYRRLDEETLHSRLEVEQFDLLPVFVWCEKGEKDETESGWQLAELRTLGDIDDGNAWYDSPSEANDAARTQPTSQTAKDSAATADDGAQVDEDGDDDDYWAAYDRTPGLTPGPNLTPGPSASSGAQANRGSRPQADADYYARYGIEVQPAMDSHDPDEDHPELGQSTLNGSALASRDPQLDPSGNLEFSRNASPLIPSYVRDKPHDSALATLDTSVHDGLSMPRPISPATSHSSVERLEEQAAAMDGADRAQIGIKQHISTDIKSLYRLAKSVGMDRQEFERIVTTELETLSIFDRDE